MSEVEHILPAHNQLGEGALWCVDEQALYWVDIERNTFSRFQPATGGYETIDVGVPIGVLALRTSGGLVMATKKGFALWDKDATELRYIINPEFDKPHLRFNDGAVDSRGRFWAGSMGGPGEGTLYRLDPDGSVHIMIPGVTTPNGIGWSPDDTLMYFTDSGPGIIYVFDYDAVNGHIINRRNFIELPTEIGTPDGLVVDCEGHIWSACWDGAKLVRYTPSGTIDRIIPVPALRPTSCVFGGPNLDELYITSAFTGLSEEQLEQYPLSGDLFRLKIDIKGREKFKFGG
jgi:sugar lactone lactonase YvrE